jgi:hypothetical protein
MQCGNFPPRQIARASENVALAPLQIRPVFRTLTRRPPGPTLPDIVLTLTDIVYGCSGAAGAEMRGSVVLATAPCLSAPRNWPRESR